MHYSRTSLPLIGGRKRKRGGGGGGFCTQQPSMKTAAAFFFQFTKIIPHFKAEEFLNILSDLG